MSDERYYVHQVVDGKDKGGCMEKSAHEANESCRKLNNGSHRFAYQSDVEKYPYRITKESDLKK